jgi:hypothetical protein
MQNYREAPKWIDDRSVIVENAPLLEIPEEIYQCGKQHCKY